MIKVKKMLRSIFYETTYRFPSHLNRIWMAHYGYMFTPAELCFLVSCIDRTRDLPGPILEVGCFRGQTTLFLNYHMNCSGIEKSYICVDTFTGFIDEDVDFEIQARRKNPRFTWGGFSYNAKRYFEKSLQMNNIRRVTAIQADVSQFDFSGIDNISLCLVDVDLYLPVKCCLEKLPTKMAKGGILIVDDCMPNVIFDGACQAFHEFVRAHHLRHEILFNKLGVLYF